MQENEIIGFLKKIEIFFELSERELNIILKRIKIVEFQKDTIIFEEDSKADAFFMIIDGVVEILKKGENNVYELLSVKKKYDFFGELSMLDKLPRSATIKAKSDLKCAKIDKDDFMELLQTIPSLAFNIAKSVSKTVRLTNELYVKDLEEKNSALQKAYEELKRTQNELIRNEKLSVIGKFSSLIIHDLKGPMTNIRAYAELIGMNVKGNEKVDKCLSIILREVDRLTDMANELLEYARGDMKLEKSNINIYSFLSTLLDTYSETFKKKNINVELKIENKDLMCNMDSDKIKRVFINLIGNSIDAIDVTERNNGKIEIEVKKENDKIKFVLIDNGCGMSDEVLEKIFEPFFTRKAKGTGLGMAIVKGIIDSHNGDIKVSSTINVGTKFEIFLPA